MGVINIRFDYVRACMLRARPYHEGGRCYLDVPFGYRQLREWIGHGRTLAIAWDFCGYIIRLRASGDTARHIKVPPYTSRVVYRSAGPGRP